MRKIVILLIKLALISIILFVHAQYIDYMNQNFFSRSSLAIYFVYFSWVIAYMAIGLIIGLNDLLKKDIYSIFALIVLLLVIPLFIHQKILINNYALMKEFVKIVSILLGVNLSGLIQKKGSNLAE